MEIDITSLLEADQFALSHSAAEGGQNAGRETWQASLAAAEETPLLDTPENLRWVTHRENTQNVSEEVRAAKLAMLKGSLKRGIDSKYSKLTETQVVEIRATKETYQVLADRFGVHRFTISRIKRGERWAHLPGIEPTPAREWIFEVFEVGCAEAKAFAWSPRTVRNRLSALRQKHPESIFRVAKRKLHTVSPES